jgi:hypothetical protein
MFPPGRWFEESRAYIDSSLRLFRDMANGTVQTTWPKARAAAFLFGHGLELFFKTAVAQAGCKFPWGHDLDILLARYREVLPQPDFAFTSGVEGFIASHRPLPYYKFLKYPERIAEIGKTWDAGMYVEIADWELRISLVQADLFRLWELIMQHYPTDAGRWNYAPDGEFEKPPRKKKSRKK